MVTNAIVVEKIMYDRKSAAESLSISIRSLDYLISQSVIPVRRIGAKVLIRHEDLKKFAKGNHCKPLVPKK